MTTTVKKSKGAPVQECAPITPSVTTDDIGTVKNKPYYFGSFYCTYKEDGSVFIWIPRWVRTTVKEHDEAIKGIIKECLETAPLSERVYVGSKNLCHCRYIGLYADDHDLCSISFNVSSDGVSTGSEAYEQPGVRAAFAMASEKLADFAAGE